MPQGFFKGMLVGAVVSAIACLGLVKALAQPTDVLLSGRLAVDSATHPDSRMNNRLYLVDPKLEPVYLRSKATDTEALYRLLDKSIQLRGEFRQLTLTTGESVLEVEVKEVLNTNPSK
ncbi:MULTISPECIES: hypothetical protein [Cyanophyceae]|uniref:Uncharacterized protein n=1 Tax=Leptolyngbya subtilissima DQ-A4 TaxID=2933933 RepID=A0ABV0JYX8_9CYAN|nr:hypothetical protein [Nodosilinea sp. FACHB-141]MBD2112363.1 hypothetical protein [Nodosilinea sp. FACHB-141]